LSLAIFADGWETFSNFPVTGGDYEDGTFIGQNDSIWTFWQCRGDQLITDQTPCLGKNRIPTSEIISGMIPDGIASFNFDYMQAFSSNVELDVYINDQWVASVTSTNEQAIIKNSGEIVVNLEGDFYFRFVQANNTSGQVSIDNISWISFGGSPDPEPTNYPVEFASTTLGTAIQLDWIDSEGDQVPLGYLIKASDENDLSLPIDGIPEYDDVDLSDGEGLKNIPFGTETYTFSGLLPNTTYYFQIFPYSNTGANIDYKTDGEPPSDDAETQSNINSEDFEDGTFGSWNIYNAASDLNWDVSDLGGALNSTWFVWMDGSGEDELSNDWLISPSLNLSNFSEKMMVFYTQWYDGDNADELRLRYSTDYIGGDPAEATWDELDFNKPPIDNEWTHSGYINLASVNGNNVHLAFQYLSSGNPRRWHVDEIEITGKVSGFDPFIEVLQPAESTIWVQDTHEEITWLAFNTSDSLRIEITDSASASNPTWTLLANAIDADAGSWSWAIPEDQVPGEDYQVRITDYISRFEGFSGIFSIIEPPVIPDIVINEIMYHPSDDLGADEDYEYVEIYNNDTAYVDLSGWYFSQGFEYIFPQDTGLDVGEYLVIARNPDSISSHYGIENVVGPFIDGGLSNSGDDIEISTSENWSVDYVDYGDGADWPEEPDGMGPSLELISPDYDNALAENWTSSLIINGTPGIQNSVLPPETITLVSPNGGEEWVRGTSHDILWTSENLDNAITIELITDLSVVGILADSIDNDGEWTWNISPDLLPGDSYRIRIYDEEDGNPLDECDTTFAIVDPPSAPAIVITEIMYNPPEIGTDSLEFLELYNNDVEPINLEGFSFSSGIDYTFPDFELAPGAYILLSADSAAIAETFNVTSFEWEGEGLSNSGELIQLVDTYDQTIDSVDYDDGPPWPAEPDGEGPSLTFCDPSLDNSIPDFWSASAHVAAINSAGDTIFATPGTGCVIPEIDIVITEIFYHPPGEENDSLEFVEIYNLGSETVSLEGCYFSQGIEFTFPDADIEPGSYLVITMNFDHFLNTFGYPAYEWLSGDLSNEGEILELKAPNGNVLDIVQYASVLPWDTLANGYGPSLTLCDPSSDNWMAENWSASTELEAVTTSGDTIYATPFTGCQIDLDADFYASETSILTGMTINFTDQSLGNIENWSWLFPGAEPASSTEQNPQGITYNLAGEYTVTLTVSNSEGEDLETKINYIQVVDTTYFDLVITEIMYNPPETGNDTLEFIELYNNDIADIDLEGFYFSEGVEYSFPDIMIESGNYIVVAADTVAFKSAFNVSALQWDNGALNNNGEDIELRDQYGIIQDYVEYDTEFPWPVKPNGTGPSLTFCNPELDNSLGMNWSSSVTFASINSEGDSIFATPGAGCFNVSIENPGQDQDVLIFPNPNNGNFTIKSDLVNTDYEIFSIIGERIQSGRLSSMTEFITIPEVKRGVYFIRFVNQEKKVTDVRKLIIN